MVLSKFPTCVSPDGLGTLAVTTAERQANEGNEEVDFVKKAALTAVSLKR
jgi:hypothetical protein